MVLVQDLVSDVEHWSAIVLTARVPVIGVHLPSGLLPGSNDDDGDGGGDGGGGGGGGNENENDDDDARFAAVVIGATRAALNLPDRVENAEDAAVTTTTKKIIFAALPGTSAARVAFHAAMHCELCGIADACAVVALDGGAFYLTLVPIRPRSRGERRSLRTFAVVYFRPGSLVFNPRPRRLSTPLLTPFNSTPISSLRMERPLDRDDVFSARLSKLPPRALDPAYQALAGKLQETETPGGWRAFRGFVGKSPGSNPRRSNSSNANATAGDSRHAAALEAASRRRPRETSRRAWDEDVDHAIVRVVALCAIARESVDVDVVSAHVAVM
jgi:hypothetical protein